MSTPAPPQSKPWYQRIGPGLITACVVIGPGSILTSSRVGANDGYQMAWVVVVAVAFMMVYTALGAKVGVVSEHVLGELIAKKAGRWLALLIGVSVFFISAAFQFGNNLGVYSAFKVWDTDPPRTFPGFVFDDYTIIPRFAVFDYLVVLFNALSIAFIFFARNLYRTVERLMMTLVAVMLLSFAVNLAFAQPEPSEIVTGFVPRIKTLDLSLLGLIGTTFVITASFYQSYLVRQKGWGHEELREGLIDARIGSVIMALITLMLMFTAAAVLRGEELNDVRDVARGLQPLFGDKGQILFCLGLFAAAYSSFIVNSMIGGFILSDGLGLGNDPHDVWPRVLTTLVLLTGMGVALYVIETGTRPVGAIVAAQAVTVVAAPLLAGTLLWIVNSRDIMGEHRAGWATNIVAGIGFVVLLAMATYTATQKVWPAVVGWMNGNG